MKNEAAEALEIRNRKQGELDALLKRLKEEFKVGTPEAGEILLKRKRVEADQLRMTLTIEVEKLEAEMRA